MEDVERAVDTILPLNPQLCLLQCTAAYPCAVGGAEPRRHRDVSRAVSRTSSSGLSDHQSGIAMTLVAFMLGARVIEKHFTLDHAAKGSDHAFSLMPEGMRRLVRDLHRVPTAIGSATKHPLPSEEQAAREDGEEARRRARPARRPRPRPRRPRREVAGRWRAAAVPARRAARPAAPQAALRSSRRSRCSTWSRRRSRSRRAARATSDRPALRPLRPRRRRHRRLRAARLGLRGRARRARDEGRDLRRRGRRSSRTAFVPTKPT